MEHHAIRQYNYHQWANGRFFEHLKTLPDEIYDQKIESVFSSISKVFAHIYQVDRMWLSVMSGDSFEETMKVIEKVKKRTPDKNLQEMQLFYDELSGQYAAFFDGQDLDEVISIEHPRYGALDTAVSELVQHVVNHGTYHRGNITAMLRQQGHAGVPTDYIIYKYNLD